MRRPQQETTMTTPLFLIGQNSRGQWIAQKQAGRCGGVFVSHAAALKFALMETGQRREAVITVPGVLELELGDRFPVIHSVPVRPNMPTRPVNRQVMPQAA
jgi:hypothetical protein